MIKQTIVHSRVITNKQSENGIPLDNQLDKLRNYASLKGYIDITVLSDAGISVKNTKREFLETKPINKQFSKILKYDYLNAFSFKNSRNKNIFLFYSKS
jgi:predicted site-specific integrase-resolvase